MAVGLFSVLRVQKDCCVDIFSAESSRWSFSQLMLLLDAWLFLQCLLVLCNVRICKLELLMHFAIRTYSVGSLNEPFKLTPGDFSFTPFSRVKSNTKTLLERSYRLSLLRRTSIYLQNFKPASLANLSLSFTIVLPQNGMQEKIIRRSPCDCLPLASTRTAPAGYGEKLA